LGIGDWEPEQDAPETDWSETLQPLLLWSGALQLLRLGEEGEVGFFLDEALEVDGEFHGVVVAPHAAFAVGGLVGVGFVVPAVGLVIDGVEDEAVVGFVGGEVGF
jgi:hypothetical protein